MSLKNLIPKTVKATIKQGLRQMTDQQKGYAARWAAPNDQNLLLPPSITIKQPIFRSTLFENKLHNIRIASQRISTLILYPSQILSFWKAVGAPNQKNGFKKGRNIIAGRLQEDYGGGLCQISGMIYHLALTAGLDILERHNHSMDIYRESERYTPLGTDATVVYGYKDLRIINNQACPIRFQFIVSETAFIGHLCSTTKIEKQAIIFERVTVGNKTIVTTRQVNMPKDIILERSIYLKE